MHFTILLNYTPQYCEGVWLSKVHLAILLSYTPQDAEGYGLVRWKVHLTKPYPFIALKGIAQ